MTRLLEREDELGLLKRLVESAGGGSGCIVLVGGEAGIGKTSLVRCLGDELPGGTTFLSGGCEPLSVPIPLCALRELVDAAGGDELAALGSDDRLKLARSVLASLSARAPAVAVIEDAHWADPLTLDLLRILARRIDRTGIVIVVTYRDDEVAANPALRLLLGDLASSPAVSRIGLRPLSGAAVRELAAEAGLDGGRLLRATGGNPFLIVEAIAAGGLLPASVRDAALARAGRLSRPAARVVDAAAVIGQRFEPALLHALVGDCTGEVEEALARGVLVADGTTLGFRHELIREALELSISPPRRAALHAHVFSLLAGQRDGVPAARLAHHAELGGLTNDAARYAMRAAQEAERVGAVRETYLQAERALRLGLDLERTERFELLVQYARALNFADPDLEDGLEAAKQAVELARELCDDRRRGRALIALSYNLWSLERAVEARAAAEQAVAAFESTNDVASLAWALAVQLRIEATAFDPSTAIETAPPVVALAADAGLEEVGLDVAISIGLARGHRGEHEALQILADALSSAGDRGFTIRRIRAYVNLITVAVALREHQRVDQVATEAVPLLEEWQVSPLPIMAIRFFRARSLLDRGRWDEALAIAGLRERWWHGEFAAACGIEGVIRARRGERGSDDLLAQAWREIVELVGPESARHGMIRLGLVEAAWLRDDRSVALAELAAARDSPAVARFARSGAELALWGARFGMTLEVPAGAPEPVLLEMEGDWRRAIAAWRGLQAPYEAALAALPGDDRAARDAMATLHKLGASAASRAFARERAARGAPAARGPRRSTLANPAGLTRREQEVLEALETGASNAVIASALHLSERTVAHHISAILGKLAVPNRHLAVEQARRRGLLPGLQDRQDAGRR